MEKLSPQLFEDAVKASDLLNAAAASTSVLKAVAWGPKWKHDFLEHGKLPKPRYPKVDISKSRENVKQARALCHGDHVVFQWLTRLCNTVENTAGLLQTRGKPEFYQFSKMLYGHPTQTMLDKKKVRFI